MKTTDVLWTIARKELGDRLRNRWIWTVGALLLACSLAIVFFGATPAGVAGLRAGGAVTASLMNLCVYLVPLLALVLGSGAVIEEKRRGTLDLILVSPVSPGAYFLGTFAGYLAALWFALLCCFVPTGLLLASRPGFDLLEYVSLAGLVLLLGAVFLGLAFLVSILARDPGRGMASSVLVWVAGVFVFDLALVGLLVLYPGQFPESVFGVLLLLNPADVFRLLCFQAMESVASPLGLAAAMQPFTPALLAGVMALWLVLPLWGGQRLFACRVATDRLV